MCEQIILDVINEYQTMLINIRLENPDRIIHEVLYIKEIQESGYYNVGVIVGSIFTDTKRRTIFLYPKQIYYNYIRNINEKTIQDNFDAISLEVDRKLINDLINFSG
jgi:hypothetical protein